MNDLEIKLIWVYSHIIKISKDYYMYYDSNTIILLNSSLVRIAFFKQFEGFLKPLVLNNGKIIIASFNLITIFKVENNQFKQIQEIKLPKLNPAFQNEILELKNKKVIILGKKN